MVSRNHTSPKIIIGEVGGFLVCMLYILGEVLQVVLDLTNNKNPEIVK